MTVLDSAPEAFPELPQFIPAYSAESWLALEDRGEHDIVLIIDFNHRKKHEFLRSGPMAVLLMTSMAVGVREVIDYRVADTDNDAVNLLLDLIN